jgi:hypothetical protein
MIPSFLSLDKLSNYAVAEQIVEFNEKSKKYGLVLTHTDALQLVETRSRSLLENGRIEIGSGTLIKIIDAFYDSVFIMQEDYSDTLNELLEIFYYFKNETLELISDEELIDLMKDYFENRCKGSLELLKDRELEKLANNLRFGVADYSNMNDPEDSDPEDEEEENY